MPKVVARVVAPQETMPLSLARSSLKEPFPHTQSSWIHKTFSHINQEVEPSTLYFFPSFSSYLFFSSFTFSLDAEPLEMPRIPLSLLIINLIEYSHPNFPKPPFTLFEMPLISSCTPQHSHHLTFFPFIFGIHHHQPQNSSLFNSSLSHEVGNCPS